MHTAIKQYMDTLCTTQWQTSHNVPLQDISTFDGQNTSKLEDWLGDIETAADILKQSHACLVEAKLWGLTSNLVCEALQAGESWDNIWNTLHFKLCNANIHTYTFMGKKNKRRMRC